MLPHGYTVLEGPHWRPLKIRPGTPRESELQGCPAGPGPRLGWSAEKESTTGRVKPFEGKRHICRPARLHVGRPALASTQDPARNSPLQGPESELQGCPQCPAGPGPRLGWSAEKESSRL